MAIQLNIFEPTVIKSALLKANSPRDAFYRLWLEHDDDVYAIRKESGSGKRVQDRRRWVFQDYDKALRFYERRIQEKTNPERKSPRKYIPTKQR